MRVVISGRSVREWRAWAACVGVSLVIGGFLGVVVPCGEVEARRMDGKRVVGFRLFDREELERAVEDRPQKVVGYLAYERIAREEGEWFAFRIGLLRVRSVTFTRGTKIVLCGHGGAKVESEAVCFWPDRWQSDVYDSRVTPVVVSKRSVWCGGDGWGPCGAVKFPAGSIRVGEIISFEVVGAVVDIGGASPSERR